MSRTTEVTIEIECELGDEYFGDWDTLSPEMQKFWEDGEGCNCEGSGVMSFLCNGCPFCKTFDEENS